MDAQQANMQSLHENGSVWDWDDYDTIECDYIHSAVFLWLLDPENPLRELVGDTVDSWNNELFSLSVSGNAITSCHSQGQDCNLGKLHCLL